MADVSAVATRHPTPYLGFLSGSMRRREAVWGYLLIAPLMLGFAVFFLLPVVASFVLAFTRWDIFTEPEWVGVRNYDTLLRDGIFIQTLWNTAHLALLFVPAAVVLSLLAALALNTNIPFRGVYRAVYFLPVLTIPVASATVWKWLYDPTYGPINVVLGSVGLLRPAWLSEVSTAMPAIVAVMVWNVLGRQMVLFLAGLRNVPQDYYEAAAIDGAGWLARFRYVTLPLLTPTTFFVVVTLTIASLQVFDIVFVMTQGGPSNSTRTIVFYLYEEAFRNFRMGYAAAISSVLFGLTLLLTVSQLWLQRRWVHYA